MSDLPFRSVDVVWCMEEPCENGHVRKCSTCSSVLFSRNRCLLTIQMPGVYQRSYKTVWERTPRPWSSAASESIGTRRKGSDGYTATKGSKREYIGTDQVRSGAKSVGPKPVGRRGVRCTNRRVGLFSITPEDADRRGRATASFVEYNSAKGPNGSTTRGLWSESTTGKGVPSTSDTTSSRKMYQSTGGMKPDHDPQSSSLHRNCLKSVSERPIY
jgi:hypothetical protein